MSIRSALSRLRLASQATRDLSDQLAWLEIDTVRVKGKREVIHLHALAGDEAEKQRPGFAALADIHGRMLAAYRAADFMPAAVLAKQCRAAAPGRLGGLYAFYEERCSALAQSRPDGWTPVTDLSSDIS